MAKKTSLRDFQEYLAGRLTTAAQGRGSTSWLGIEVGNEAWLVDLYDSGEIVQAPQLAPVPLTTVRSPARLIGATGVRHLLSIIAGNGSRRWISTRCWPAGRNSP